MPTVGSELSARFQDQAALSCFKWEVCGFQVDRIARFPRVEHPPEFLGRVFPRLRSRKLVATLLNGGSGFPKKVSSRSEEHTSKLQSLMRISYAVFCLKKKTKHNIVRSTPK